MRVLRNSALATTLPLLLLACASGRPSGAPPPDRNLITLREIEASGAETAYQLVQQLRPRWMVRNRGNRTFAETEADFARVIVDDLPPREFAFLHEIRRETVQEVRYLDPREATFLYGTGYNAGIVKVTTRR